MPYRASREKKDFDKTIELKGDNKSYESHIYVIQRHQATRLHYDLRLEMDGVLRSWAVPEEPPVKPGIRRLAVAVEDLLLPSKL